MHIDAFDLNMHVLKLTCINTECGSSRWLGGPAAGEPRRADVVSVVVVHACVVVVVVVERERHVHFLCSSTGWEVSWDEVRPANHDTREGFTERAHRSVLNKSVKGKASTPVFSSFPRKENHTNVEIPKMSQIWNPRFAKHRKWIISPKSAHKTDSVLHSRHQLFVRGQCVSARHQQ